ncbi:MAG: lamin tail domain-containing protein [Chloroflexota bacterium]
MLISQHKNLRPQKSDFWQKSDFYISVLMGMVLTFLFLLPQTVSAQANTIIINELFIDPPDKTMPEEFIELYNPLNSSIDLSGWSISGGVDMVIPNGTTIAANGYLVLAQDPTTMLSEFGVSAVGPWQGRLSSVEETVELRDALGEFVDMVDYNTRFPWPVATSGLGSSLELIHPDLDNDLGSSWRASGYPNISSPTPGSQNTVYSTTAPPNIRKVNHSPVSPTSSDVVSITAKVTDPDGVMQVTLDYQLVEPGQYVEINDAAYNAGWTTVNMNDSGVDGDETANDDFFTVELPASIQQHRRLVRYRIRVVDGTGQAITVPYADDPTPNFAYFVYNGVPTYSAAIQPGAGGSNGQVVDYDFATMEDVPVYHFISKSSEVDDVMFSTPRGQKYTGSDYLWYGTMVYDGVVYDHIKFRSRGGVWRHAMGKTMWKFNFNAGNRLQAHDDYGRPYATLKDKLNLSALIQQGNYLHRGEQGLFEGVGFRLFNLMGVEAPNTHFVHLRVIDSANESGPDHYHTGGANQYGGDFWGLYLAFDHMDGRFLDEKGLPDGNLYKMEAWTGQLKNQGPTAATNGADLSTFLGTYNHSQGCQPPNAGVSDDWWRQNLDLDRYYSYRSVVESIHHYDIAYGKNYYYYLNPETDKWQLHPWDLDLTWANNMFGNGNHGFVCRVLQRAAFNIDYQNQMREYIDLLYNTDEGYRLIDEVASLVHTPGQPSIIDADRAMWDYNPIMTSNYVNPSKSGAGRYYQQGATKDFPGMMNILKTYIVDRTAWINSTLLTSNAHPNKPTLTYTGAGGYPVDQLSFQSSAFGDPQGNNTFAAMAWRVGEITDPTAPNYDPDAPGIYEVTSLWESGELSSFDANMTLPAGACPAGSTCRVRVRHKDNTGRWSHWSDAVQFTATEAAAPQDFSSLIVSEVHYNPEGDDEFEYIEFKNGGATPLVLDGVVLSSATNFVFPENTTLAAGAYITVIEDETAFFGRYTNATSPWYYAGIAVAGTWSGKLGNSGETIVLTAPDGMEILRFAYDDTGSWPGRADGNGSAAELENPNAVPNTQPEKNNYLADGDNWRPTSEFRGSPGRDGAGPDNRIVVNELLSNSEPPTVDTIEFYNTTDGAIDISGWFVSDTSDAYRKYTFPAGTIIDAGGFLVIDESDFNDINNINNWIPFALSSNGDDVYLMEADNTGYLLKFVDRAEFGAAAVGEALGLWPDGQGELYPMQQTTFGASNGSNGNGVRVGSVVISEIHYNPLDTDGNLEFVEITNNGATTESLANWRLRGEVDVDFDGSVSLAPNESLVVVRFDPTNSSDADAFRAAYSVPNDVQLIGPWHDNNITGVHLSNGGGTLKLQRPGELVVPGNGTPSYYAMLFEDQVQYDDDAPWVTEPDGTGPSLSRIDLAVYGDDPTNWEALTPPLLSCVDIQSLAGLAIGRVNFDAVRLSWTAPADGSTVEVWRSEQPYFIPGDAGSTLLATLNDTVASYDDTGAALGDVATNHYYGLRKIDRCGDMADAGNVGEFEYGLIESGSSDFTWVGLPLLVDGITDSASLVNHIEANSSQNKVQVTPDVQSVDRWNNASQSFDSYLPELPFLGEIPVATGGVYRVSVDLPGEPVQEAIWTLLGAVPDASVFTQQLRATGSTNNNWVMLPLDAVGLDDAELLIGNVQSGSTPTITIVSADKWNNSAQSLDSYLAGFPFPAFNTQPGHAYRLSLDDGVVPGTVADWE